MAVAFIPILSDTRDLIKYSVTTLDEGEWIMLMKRPVISATGTGLLAPFTFNVWIMILISLLVVGPLIYCIIFVRNCLTGDKSQLQYGLPHCMWFVYGALLKQGRFVYDYLRLYRFYFVLFCFEFNLICKKLFPAPYHQYQTQRGSCLLHGGSSSLS